jgi:hypothetical protein
VTTDDQPEKVQLTSSYPSAADTWTVVGVGKVANNKTWSVRAYVICAS